MGMILFGVLDIILSTAVVEKPGDNNVLSFLGQDGLSPVGRQPRTKTYGGLILSKPAKYEIDTFIQ